ncbi:stage V sporulation protein S [bacterium]|nr:stage V sporulation protein S [bacterium]
MQKPIKVAAKSDAPLVAGAIVGIVREHGQAQIQAVGANAVNQAVKAVAIARSYLVEEKMDLYTMPTFVTIEIGGRSCTAIRFYVRAMSALTGVACPVAEEIVH